MFSRNKFVLDNSSYNKQQIKFWHFISTFAFALSRRPWTLRLNVKVLFLGRTERLNLIKITSFFPQNYQALSKILLKVLGKFLFSTCSSRTKTHCVNMTLTTTTNKLNPNDYATQTAAPRSHKPPRATAPQCCQLLHKTSVWLFSCWPSYTIKPRKGLILKERERRTYFSGGICLLLLPRQDACMFLSNEWRWPLTSI